MLDSWEVSERLKLPLAIKVRMTQDRIHEWWNRWEGQVYVSFSGGKDSTVLAHVVHNLYPEVPLVFLDTGLEWPDIAKFAEDRATTVLRPGLSFYQVIKKYGYPVVSKETAQKVYEARRTHSEKLRNKRLHGDALGRGGIPKKWLKLLDAPFPISHMCCTHLKKIPAHNYERNTGYKPIVGTMLGESSLRRQAYMRQGCNAFESKRPMSQPMMFWTTADVWQYLRENNVPYSPIYDKGVTRTGCMFCCFGTHLEKAPNKFQLMHQLEPQKWDYCINRLGLHTVLDYIGVDYL